jgi:putative transposase
VWIGEVDPEARTRIVGRARARAPVDKQAAVIALCTRQGSAKAVAQELGVSRYSLYNWRTQLLGQDARASMKPKQDPPQVCERTELEQQLKALRQEIRRLQLEQDILKKANELIKKAHQEIEWVILKHFRVRGACK